MSVLEQVAVERPRFAPHPEWFVCGQHGGMHCVRAWAPAERALAHALALMPALATDVDPTVDVHLRDERRGRAWAGARIEVRDITDAVSRTRLPLAAFGGVELSLATATDQLVLTPELLLVLYSTTPRWPYLLEARGLMERADWPTPTWRATHASTKPWLDASDEALTALDAALAQLAERWSLVEVHA